MKLKNVNLGNEISRILAEKRISKAQFADSIGVKRQNVNRDILEKASLDSTLMCRISEVLGVNLFSLFIENNQFDYNVESKIKARIIIEMGAEKQEKTATFIFGQNKVELK